MEEMSRIRALLERVPQKGQVEWIGLRPGRRTRIEIVSAVVAEAGRGLRGDHYAASGGDRQLTLIQAEHLPVIAALCGRSRIDPAVLRRNLVVSGVPLAALAGRRFRIGGALCEGVGDCAPCARMEEALGPGGYQAMRGHGGITARILRGGRIRVGDEVSALDTTPAEPTADASE